MSGFVYYLTTFLESGLSVFGIRAPYEQPRYGIIGHLPNQVEIRAYPARVAVETAMDDANDGEAFGKLFRYIAGANRGGPVEQGPRKIPMTIPVEMSGSRIMRFFVPENVVKAGPPEPTDPTVRIVTLPPADFAVIRFSGTLTDTVRSVQTGKLTQAIAGSAWHVHGEACVLTYDPPFAIPFLRRNEIALPVTSVAGSAARTAP
jgi:hypothetical protein